MANKASPEPTGITSTLQRGKACLRCRKRKMRCDGGKPACQQCSRAKKGDACEYDDGKGKTRTQLLRENISRLEQRIRELEDPEYTSPSVTLFDPHAHQRSSSSSSLSIADSPGSTSISTTHSPYPSEPTSSPSGSWNQLSVSPAATSASSSHLTVEQGVPSPSPTPFCEPFQLEEPPLPFELAQLLLDIFEPHRNQCGLKIHMGRLRDSLGLSPSEQHHPVLINSIFLWACYMSRPGPLSQHESHYLSRALDSLHDALQYPYRAVDVIQASCLLSMYFLSNGRVLEGSYHASAAASLAIQWGLHGGVHNDGTVGPSGPIPCFRLEPPKDRIEEGERILAFWQVYNLDRCWSVVLHKPVTIPDVHNSFASINVPWPLDIEEYESGQPDEGPNYQTIRSFFDGQASNVTGGFSTLALRVKASALFEHADRLSAAWDPRLARPHAFAENFHALECTISHFLSTLIPVHQLDAAVPEDKQALLAVHSLTQASLIHLYYRRGESDQMSYEKCLRAARSGVNIIKHITEADFDFLDPIVGPCWTCVADTLVRELNNMESSWPPVHTADIRSEIGTVLYALNNLSVRFPLLAFSVAKVQKRLGEM